MKLGNVSQSIIPVPDFYFTRSLREMDTFSVSTFPKKYFTEKGLFKQTKDINLNNNLRNRHRRYEKYNREKFIPIHRLNQNKKEETKQEKKTFDDSYDSDDENKAGKNELPVDENSRKYLVDFREALDKKSENLRNEVKNNLDNLMVKLNTIVDKNKYSNYDTSQNYYKANAEEYSDITHFNINNENETNKFKKLLKDKIISLGDSIVGDKNRIVNNMNKKEELQNTSFLPYLSARANFESTLKNLDEKELRIKFYETMKINGYLPPTRNNFYLKRDQREDYHVDQHTYNSTKCKNMFCENYNHIEFLKKYNNQ
jgi:hypothetical protein